MAKQKKPGRGDLQGEGNYDAAEQYDEAVRKTVKRGNVEKAARDAAPKSRDEARELEEAEEEGRSHARGGRSDR